MVLDTVSDSARQMVLDTVSGIDLANGTGYTVSSLGTVLLAMQYWYHAPLDDAVTTMGA